MTDGADEAAELITAVQTLRDRVASTRLPLDLIETAGARVNQKALLDQLDDYVLPRLRSLDAPLLAVIGGSTGAGKSTLINSIVGANVSTSGVLRPTTTNPVIVHHPQDRRWFADQRILPGLARSTGAVVPGDSSDQVTLVESDTLPAGMALLDAPDIDSVVDANRALAGQLLAAADLWLFVTTAARYADAVPWDLLRTASERGTAVAIVLDRIDLDTVAEVRPHLAEMLRDQGLQTAPIFTVVESVLDGEGRLPEQATERLRGWLTALGGDAHARSIIITQTLHGAMASLAGRTEELIDATRVQAGATSKLNQHTAAAYEQAATAIQDGMTDGTLLRGEVLARWQEFVGTGEFFKQVERRIAKARDRVTSAVKGQPLRQQEDLDEAIQTGVAALITAQVTAAGATVRREWRRLPGGEQVLTAHPELAAVRPDLEGDIERLVRDWQSDLLELIRTESGNRRTNARIAAYGINGVGLFLMLVSFAHTGGVLIAPEVAIASGTSVLAQKVLEAIFGDQEVRTMAKKARDLLRVRVADLLTAEQSRFDAAVGGAQVAMDQSEGLQQALEATREVSV